MTLLSESLLSQLRAATSQLHRELDTALDLTGRPLTRQDYVAFLLGSLTALEPLEAQLQPWLNVEPISRCELLRKDLAALAAPCAVRQLPDVPSLHGNAAAIGARYVVEGSALGGTILSRSFDTLLGLDGKALSYLTLHGERLGEHWRAFVAELERFGQMATPQERIEACDSARAVFKLYGAAFRSTGAIAVGPP